MHTAHAAGLAPVDGTAFMWEVANRNKRSIGVDLAHPDGREVLYELARQADVFLTNFLAPARRRLEIDVEHIRAVNPSVIYARGTGQGTKGPDRDAGGFDSVSYWSRSGWASPLAASAGKFLYQPAPGCGDLTSGFALAAGIVGALFKRERTGEPSVVDVSLLSSGMWAMSGSITASDLYGMDIIPIREKHQVGNALTAGYRTRDGRFVFLSAIRHDLGFDDLARRLGREAWTTDPRFANHEARLAHHLEFVQALDEAFAERTLEEWRDALDGMDIPWSAVQSTREVARDPQALANGYVQDVAKDGGPTLRLATTPVQFDEQPPVLRPAPEPAQHTEEILLELGRSWDDIEKLKSAGAVT
jgi:crotonobetainyl-CoA:carnitine CoA-transferase CaiB-like acyl-CoA transferase